MSSKIEQIIEEIEEYIDGCKPQSFSKTNIIVNKEEIEELLRELRMKTPEEIKRYQKVLANRDAILADAQAKADDRAAATLPRSHTHAPFASNLCDNRLPLCKNPLPQAG